MRYVLALILVLLVGSIVTAVTQVRPGERVVVRRFGRVIATPGPGLWIGLPWGMDRIDRVRVDQRRRVPVGYSPEEDESGLTAPAGQLLTGDHNLVNVQVVLHYSVNDREVVPFIEQGDRADGLIARAAETVLAEWVAARAIDDVLLQGKTQLPLVLVRGTQERIEAYHLGVRIHDADVAHLFPPREVKSAFDDVTKAQTSIRTREHEALQEAANRRRAAETQKFKLERETESHVVERLRLAKAEAERFEKRLYQYQRLRRSNPHFLAAIWWEEIGQLFTRLKENGGLDMLDNHLGPDGLDITLFPPGAGKK
jgi:membrane protease subunit HflK